MTIIDVEEVGTVDLDRLLIGDLPLKKIPFPLRLRVSGTYTWRRFGPPLQPERLPIKFPPRIPIEGPLPTPGGGVEVEEDVPDVDHGSAFIPALLFEELRLDVDGSYPQMTASGRSTALLSTPRTWIASIARIGSWRYAGPITYTDGYGPAGFAFDHVDIKATPSLLAGGGKAVVVYSSRSGASLTRVYSFTTPYFHRVEFEFDSTSDAEPVFEIGTHDHPNRPASLANESLSIDDVFRRAGFDVKRAPDGTVPVSGAGANSTWSDAEMHDAMQTYWSRFANAPQWSLWTFWARQHDMGHGLGGIMFDDIGPNHRQGTAIFTDSFIRDAPSGDAAPDAWDRRMRFWTAVHEMGHAFNLAHSWQKSLGTPWIPLSDQPEARSFMNYPYFVSGGQAAFFSDFAYRFSNEELLFLRHAPSRFVQMGNADWFDHHAFEQAFGMLPPAEYRFEVRANRERAVFDFLEPVVLEVKLTNTSGAPKIVPGDVLNPQHILTIVSAHGKDARQWVPFARTCTESKATVLNPGESLYASLPVFAGLNGWDVSEPGEYRVVAVVEIDGHPVRSEPFSLKVAPPRSFEEAQLAGDFLNEGVGRALAFAGTEIDASAKDTLRETIDRLPGSRAAIHAAVAIARPLARDYKLLEIPDGAAATSLAEAGGRVRTRKADVDEAVQIAAATLATAEAAESLGHIRVHDLVDAFTQDVAREGAAGEAAELQMSMHDVFKSRGVLPRVLEEVAATAASFAPSRPSRASASRTASKPAASRRRTGGSSKGTTKK
ncbi:hypothetical protein ASD19_04565 [Microbacterium sp. Root53]|uniref:hypothetical protein n=1 Tax=Microbacterium sp. Root53 TaxID=1736553 RepID=UPI0006FC8855|nr:hypothetical protein [Microbacterium sp. Root53]KQY99170.1 hypothetical protein ASD19_04565 [Microbacterium sp. Root53]